MQGQAQSLAVEQGITEHAPRSSQSSLIRSHAPCKGLVAACKQRLSHMHTWPNIRQYIPLQRFGFFSPPTSMT